MYEEDVPWGLWHIESLAGWQQIALRSATPEVRGNGDRLFIFSKSTEL